jgi:Spy/CpxP family protein refolding chaperone
MKTYKIAILILMMSLSLFAQRGRGSGGLGWDADLNLSPEQLQQITSLQEQVRSAKVDHRTEIQKLRVQLDQATRQEKINQKAVDKLLARIQEHELALEKLQINHRSQVRALLTPDQQIIFDQRGGYAGSMRGSGRGNRGANAGSGDCDGDGTPQNGRRGGRGKR